ATTIAALQGGYATATTAAPASTTSAISSACLHPEPTEAAEPPQFQVVRAQQTRHPNPLIQVRESGSRCRGKPLALLMAEETTLPMVLTQHGPPLPGMPKPNVSAKDTLRRLGPTECHSRLSRYLLTQHTTPMPPQIDPQLNFSWVGIHAGKSKADDKKGDILQVINYRQRSEDGNTIYNQN
ncbi:hypothetical protein E2320_022823, partial [Naja naja]